MRNIHIDRKNETAELNLNLALYPEETIEKAMNHFRGLCRFDTKKTSDRISIKMKMKTKGLKAEHAVYEFVNHLLAEAKNKQAGGLV